MGKKNYFFMKVDKIIFIILSFFFFLSRSFASVKIIRDIPITKSINSTIAKGYSTNDYKDGYLPYCGSLSNSSRLSRYWTTYPSRPDNIYTCLNKRYCSDIKIRKLKIGDWIREEGDVVKSFIGYRIIRQEQCSNVSVDIETFTDASGVKVSTNVLSKEDGMIKEITAGKTTICDENGFEREVDTTKYVININNTTKVIEYITSTNKTIDGTSVSISNALRANLDANAVCLVSIEEPIIFSGDIFVDSTTNTVSRIDRNAVLYFENPNSSDCYMKSCEDLTIEEYEAIYNNYRVITYSKDDSGRTINVPSNIDVHYYNYCNQYKYDREYDMKSSSIGMIKYKDNNSDKYYCHEQKNRNFFQYMIGPGKAYDTDGNVYKDVFNCYIHQCPLSGKSLTCWSNFFIFSEKDENGNLIRDPAWQAEYKEYIMGSDLSYSSLCEQVSCTYNAYSSSDYYACSKSTEGDWILNEKCDEYDGIERDIKNYWVKSTDADELKRKGQQKLNYMYDNYPKNTCIQTNETSAKCSATIDCGLDKNKKESKCVTNNIDTDASVSALLREPDYTWSWFERPVPAPMYTEILDDYALQQSCVQTEYTASEYNIYDSNVYGTLTNAEENCRQDKIVSQALRGTPTYFKLYKQYFPDANKTYFIDFSRLSDYRQSNLDLYSCNYNESGYNTTLKKYNINYVPPIKDKTDYTDDQLLQFEETCRQYYIEKKYGYKSGTILYADKYMSSFPDSNSVFYFIDVKNVVESSNSCEYNFDGYSKVGAVDTTLSDNAKKVLKDMVGQIWNDEKLCREKFLKSFGLEYGTYNYNMKYDSLFTYDKLYFINLDEIDFSDSNIVNNYRKQELNCKYKTDGYASIVSSSRGIIAKHEAVCSDAKPLPSKGVFIHRRLVGMPEMGINEIFWNDSSDDTGRDHYYRNQVKTQESFLHNENEPSDVDWGIFVYKTYDKRGVNGYLKSYFKSEPQPGDYSGFCASDIEQLHSYQGYKMNRKTCGFHICTFIRQTRSEYLSNTLLNDKGLWLTDGNRNLKICKGTTGLITTSVGGFDWLNDRATCTYRHDNTAWNQCHVPQWDSMYIRGEPVIIWSSTTPTIEKLSLVVCMRKKNTNRGVETNSKSDVCGARMCSADCGFSICTTQYCGKDICVKLTYDVNKNEDCSLEGLEKSTNWENMGCVKSIGDYNRFRLQNVYGNKYYVFYDEKAAPGDCYYYQGLWEEEDKRNQVKKAFADAFGPEVELAYHRTNIDNIVIDKSTTPYYYSPYSNDEGKSRFRSFETLVERLPGGAIDKDSFAKNRIRAIGGQFVGHIIGTIDLVDNNDLEDLDGDGYITDYDVYGEWLYHVWNCGAINDDSCVNENGEMLDTDNCKFDSRCTTYQTGQIATVGGEGKDKYNRYHTIDIVQYIGNNQPIPLNPKHHPFSWEIGSSGHSWETNKCKVGQLHNCRGYYDHKGTFHREQQAIIAPMPIGPLPFYKYATFETSPDMFLPLLVIYSFVNTAGNVVKYSSTENSDIYLHFFTPSIVLDYGGNRLGISLDFQETEKKGSISSTFNNDKITADWRFRKSATYDSGGTQAQVCLYQVLKGSNENFTSEQLVACLRRANPDINNFMIMDEDISGASDPNNINPEITDESLKNRPTFNAYYHKNPFTSLKFGDVVSNLDDTNNFIQFYNKKDVNVDDVKKDETLKSLLAGTISYGQNMPISIENDTCSELYYMCVKYRKLLYQQQYKMTSDVLLNHYQSVVNRCDNVIETYCNSKDGYPQTIQKFSLNGNSVSEKFLTIKENYNVDGAYNQACVVAGFEDYKTYVFAEKSSQTYVGKCVLNDESKKLSECRRKEYYEFCLNNNDDTCICINETDDECDCSDGISCIKTISCECSGDDCINLPEECFLPGVNTRKTLFERISDNSAKLANVCVCSTTSEPIGTVNNKKKIVREATNREVGLCVPLRDLSFCEPIKYYDKNKTYHDGGQENKLNTIKSKYYSNIWRTQQKRYGRYFVENYGHAEFDKSNDCSLLKNGYEDEYCLQIRRCYNDEGRECIDPGKDCSSIFSNCTEQQKRCKCEYVHAGSCNGFWKNRYENTTPLAKCESVKIGGETVSMLKMIPETGCIRYSCPTIDSFSAVIPIEISESGEFPSEMTPDTVNLEGKFHGYAYWDSYTKGSDLERKSDDAFKECYNGYELDSNGNYTIDSEGNIKCKGDEIYEENGYGDDIEERQANSCQEGFGPAGLKYILEEYHPYITSSNGKELTNDIVINKQENVIIRTLLGYDLDSSIFDTNNNVKSSVTSNKTLTEYKEYMTKTNYNPRSHLPRRYCSQIGEWMQSNDIYTYNDKLIYYKTNSNFKSRDSNGFINSSLIQKFKDSQNNYGEVINYSKRYCERLYCSELSENNLGLISIETSNPEDGSVLKYSTVENNEYIPNTTKYLNYPKILLNPNDNRINNKVVNIKTTWRHLGGAVWSETPAIRDINSLYSNVIGTCVESKNFFPSGTKFWSEDLDLANGSSINQPTFSKQYNKIVAFKYRDNPSYTFDLKSADASTTEKGFRADDSKDSEIEPNRLCSRWGVWQSINNRCEATCEALAPFHTSYKDINNNKLVENYEVTQFFGQPKNTYRNFAYPHAFTDENGNTLDYTDQNRTEKIRYGDIYTGGARWPRIKAGSVVLGECDASIGRIGGGGREVDLNAVEFPETGIQFIRTGPSSDIVAKIPQYIKDENGTSVGIIDKNTDGLSDIGRYYREETINTNGRPWRVCQLDGTWGPVHNPCANFITCPSVTPKTNDTKFILSTGSVTDNIIDVTDVFEGGDISLSEVTTTSASGEAGTTIRTRIAREKVCNTAIYEKGGVYHKTCDITDGLWKSDTDEEEYNTCVIKTCPQLDIKIGDTTYKTIEDGTYYIKESGYTGAISLFYGKNHQKKNYLGYEFVFTCPTGYYCANCEKYGGKYGIKYTCRSDGETNNRGVWVMDVNELQSQNGITANELPQCVPYSCQFTSTFDHNYDKNGNEYQKSTGVRYKSFGNKIYGNSDQNDTSSSGSVDNYYTNYANIFGSSNTENYYSRMSIYIGRYRALVSGETDPNNTYKSVKYSYNYDLIKNPTASLDAVSSTKISSNDSSNLYYDTKANHVSLGITYSQGCRDGYFIPANWSWGDTKPYARCEFENKDAYKRCFDPTYAGYSYDGISPAEPGNASNFNSICGTSYSSYGECTPTGCPLFNRPLLYVPVNKQASSTLEKSLSEKNARLQELYTELAQLKTQFNSMRDEINKKVEQAKLLEEEINNLSTELKNKQNELIDAIAEVNATKTNLDNKETIYNYAKDDYKSKQSNTETTEADLEIAKNNLDNAELEYNNAQSDYESARDKYDTISDEIEQINQQKEEKKKELNALRAEIDLLYKNSYNSTDEDSSENSDQSTENKEKDTEEKISDIEGEINQLQVDIEDINDELKGSSNNLQTSSLISGGNTIKDINGMDYFESGTSYKYTCTSKYTTVLGTTRPCSGTVPSIIVTTKVHDVRVWSPYPEIRNMTHGTSDTMYVCMGINVGSGYDDYWYLVAYNYSCNNGTLMYSEPYIVTYDKGRSVKTKCPSSWGGRPTRHYCITDKLQPDDESAQCKQAVSINYGAVTPKVEPKILQCSTNGTWVGPQDTLACYKKCRSSQSFSHTRNTCSGGLCTNSNSGTASCTINWRGEAIDHGKTEYCDNYVDVDAGTACGNDRIRVAGVATCYDGRWINVARTRADCENN